MKTTLLEKQTILQRRLPDPSTDYKLRFLVHYDGGLAALAALKAAIRMAAPGTEIVALSCIPVPRSHPVDMLIPNSELRAKAILAAAVANAAMHGVSIRTEIIQCHSLKQALIERANRGGANVMFLGVEHADLADETDPLADYVLRHAKSKVVVVQR